MLSIIYKNAKVKLDIAGDGIRADIANIKDLGTIDFMPGCKVDMIIRNYLRHPYKFQMNPTITAGIKSNNTINFDGADVNIVMIADKKTCDEYTRIFPDYVVEGTTDPYSMSGISSQTHSPECELNITNSKINIKEECINFPKNEERLVYARGINFYCNSDNNDTTSTNIINSVVNIDIPDTNNNISDSYGLDVIDANIIDSKLNINVNSLNKTIGIRELKISFIAEHTDFYELFVKNSDVNINSNDIGVLAERIGFDYKDSEKKFKVNADNYGILSTFSKTGEEERKFEKHYVPEGISLKFKTIEETMKPINIFSSKTSLREYFENDSYSVLDLFKSGDEVKEIEQDNLPFIIKTEEVPNYDKEVGIKFIRGIRPNYIETLIAEKEFEPNVNVFSDAEEVDTYYYYETFYNKDKKSVANNVVIEGFKNKEKEKEVIPQKQAQYVVPNTCVK